MNLKIEDLDKNSNAKKILDSPPIDNVSIADSSLSRISVESKNLILQSMKDALVYMVQQKETSDYFDKNKNSNSPPKVYERII